MRSQGDAPATDFMIEPGQQEFSQSHTGGWEGSLSGGWGISDPPALPSKSLSSPRLILIGVVHGDPLGYARAWKLLGRFRPDMVTVEISPFSVRYRLKVGPRWQRTLQKTLEGLPAGAQGHLALRRVAAQVALPFEMRVARDWQRRWGTPWRALDLGEPARQHLRRYDRELLSPENLRALLNAEDEPLEDYVAREFRRAAQAFRRAPWRLPPPPHALTSRREDFLARRLRRLAAGGPRVVHLGGWEHSVAWEDGSGLCHRLADLKPLRLLLAEADFLPEEEISC
jgi:hypothetical protein